MNRVVVVSNPIPSDNFFYRLWQNERENIPCSSKPIEMRWYELAEFNPPKIEVKRLYNPNKEVLKKWGL